MAIPTSIADLTWLGPGEPAGAPFARGASAGASIANAWQNRRQVDMQAAERAELQRVRQAEEARKAKEAAIQFAGFQDYQAAVGQGMPPDEAIKQFGAAMFYKSATFPNFVSAQERSQIASERASETAKYHTDLLKQRDDVETRLGSQFDRNLSATNKRNEEARKVDREQIDAANKRAGDAEEGRNQRQKDAIQAQKERDLFRVENRIDPKTGKVLSEAQFVDRHLNTFINLGIDEKDAVKRIKAVFKEISPTSGVAPAPSETGVVVMTKPDGSKVVVPRANLQTLKDIHPDWKEGP